MKLGNRLAMIIKRLSICLNITQLHALHEVLSISCFLMSGTYKLNGQFCNDFFILLGESGCGKTRAQKVFTDEIESVLESIKEDYERDLLKYQSSKEAKNKSKVLDWEVEVKKKPLSNSMIVNEGTKEGILNLLTRKDNIPLLVLRSAESEGFFQDVGGVKQGAKACTMLNSLWSNERVNKILVKYDNVKSTRLDACVSINFCMKREGLLAHMATEENVLSGFTSRLLLCETKRLPYKTPVFQVEDCEVLQAFLKDVREMVRDIVRRHGDEGIKYIDIGYRDGDEKERMEEIRLKVDKQTEEGGLLEHCREFGYRMAEHILRIVPALMWIEGEHEVCKERINSAYSIVKMYAEQQLKIMDKCNREDIEVEDLKEKVKVWLKGKIQGYISRRELIRSVLRRGRLSLHEKVFTMLSEEGVLEDCCGNGVFIDGKMCYSAFRIIGNKQEGIKIKAEFLKEKRDFNDVLQDKE